jgi:hypothetical protein
MLPVSGPSIATEADAVALIGDAVASSDGGVAIPATRLADAFFDLRSGLLGQVAQRFEMYGVRLAIVGDVSAYEERSAAFRDFVRETNRRSAMWFVADEPALKKKIDAQD